ncbi:hypothetical protein M3201_04745 [Paenibacillus motobuensis]|uniref:hypothetical protein n=1 Tax=Paenibacillus TaxID=44249 RepID=UPI002040BCE2|nr:MULTISPECIES: hypothetical protein [Paenibacillus]MCM3039006.1 hypothetical protein [Paenibacillus lutimineralis]MCM3646110.1 hypothetical protein [Paenibacillus motobuensis]
MIFTIGNKGKINFQYCASDCVLKNINDQPDEICFAGFSKRHNKGLRFKDVLYLERLAQSWDAEVHDFGITVNRDNVVKRGEILKGIQQLNDPNLLKIIDICSCTVVVEYIDGNLLNAKKEKWLLGPLSYTTDYIDLCDKKELVSVFRKIGNLILKLHKNGICHTDPTDHNVMVSSFSGEPILIDIIGAMPFEEEFQKLDNIVFLNHLVIPSAHRKGIQLPETILKQKSPEEIIERVLFYLDDIDLS